MLSEMVPAEQLGTEYDWVCTAHSNMSGKFKTIYTNSMQNQYGPPIMTNGEQVRFLFQKLDFETQKIIRNRR